MSGKNADWQNVARRDGYADGKAGRQGSQSNEHYQRGFREGTNARLNRAQRLGTSDPVDVARRAKGYAAFLEWYEKVSAEGERIINEIISSYSPPAPRPEPRPRRRRGSSLKHYGPVTEEQLEEIEWHQQMWNGAPECPVCGGYQPSGHDDEPQEGHFTGCWLADMLGRKTHPAPKPMS